MPLKGFRKSHCLRGHLLSEPNVLEYVNKGYVTRHCRECSKLRQKRYLKGNKEYDKLLHRDQHRIRTFKMPPQEYERKLKEQNGTCAICSEKLIVSPNVDHDRSCCLGKKSCGRCVRGLLCWRCNTVLGKMLDSPELLREAADYIEKWRGVHASRASSGVAG